MLDDEPTLLHRLAVAAIVVLMAGILLLPFSPAFGDESEDPRLHEENARETQMCGEWDSVPTTLQDAANRTYPMWNWICRLVVE